MAIIKSGLIIRTNKSAGGMNFYNRKGVQCLRNKPVRGDNYIPSAAQKLQNAIFKAVTLFRQNTPGIGELIQYGFGARFSGKGRTSYNNFQSEVLYSITRDANGAKLSPEESQTNLTTFEGNPSAYFNANCRLTKSAYAPFVFSNPVTVSGSAGAYVASTTITIEEVQAWLNTWTQVVISDTEAKNTSIIVKGDVLGAATTVPYIEGSIAWASGVGTVTFPVPDLTAASNAEAAIYFHGVLSSSNGYFVVPAISEATHVVVPAP